MAVLNYEYDPSLVSNPVRELLNSLFGNADIREAKDEWLKCFTDDAKIWRNGKSSNGGAGDTLFSLCLLAEVGAKVFAKK